MMLRAVVGRLHAVMRRRVMALGGREVLAHERPATAISHDLPVGHLMALPHRRL
jgi:hypothetical protein